jgi:ribokinase
MNILSLGDLVLDLLIRFDPLCGETDAAPDAVQLWPGGSAANFAVWAARLGATVQFVSRVGRDWPGEMLIHSLEAEGIGHHVSVVDEPSTGRVLVIIDNVGVRRMWPYPGASATISPEDLDPTWFRDLDAFHLTGYSLLRDGPRAAALQALRLARAYGTPICTLDPNTPHLIVDFGPRPFREMLAQLQFDMIFPSIEEGQLLSGLDDAEAIAVDLLELSPLVVLTMGERGCLVVERENWERGRLRGASAEEISTRLRAKPKASELLRVPAQRVNVLDATGAGDAFAASFVVEYFGTADLYTAAQMANHLAAEVVCRVGAR